MVRHTVGGWLHEFRDSGDAATFDVQLALDRDRLRHGAGDAALADKYIRAGQG